MNPFIHYFSLHAALLMFCTLLLTWWYLSNGIKSAVHLTSGKYLPVWLVIWVFMCCILIWPSFAIIAWEERLKERKKHPVDYALQVLQRRLDDHRELYNRYHDWVEYGKPESLAPMVGDMNKEEVSRLKEKIEELKHGIQKLEK